MPILLPYYTANIPVYGVAWLATHNKTLWLIIWPSLHTKYATYLTCLDLKSLISAFLPKVFSQWGWLRINLSSMAIMTLSQLLRGFAHILPAAFFVCTRHLQEQSHFSSSRSWSIFVRKGEERKEHEVKWKMIELLRCTWVHSKQNTINLDKTLKVFFAKLRQWKNFCNLSFLFKGTE